MNKIIMRTGADYAQYIGKELKVFHLSSVPEFKEFKDYYIDNYGNLYSNKGGCFKALPVLEKGAWRLSQKQEQSPSLCAYLPRKRVLVGLPYLRKHAEVSLLVVLTQVEFASYWSEIDSRFNVEVLSGRFV